MSRLNTAVDFWARVDKSGDCWLWIGATTTAGYGRISWQGRPSQAHRIAYELAVGPIPDGLEIDHLCRVHGCVNPDHLEPVTHRENGLRGVGIAAVNAAKTHCKNGHPLSGDNLRVYKRTNGRPVRYCRTCHNASSRRTYRDLKSRADAFTRSEGAAS